ncbi:hypothetical protein [Pararhodobacter sp.]|uniref:hypothetical protein n=1 Tax=Pararhodobacter sp. TaxID=2127056 RepID=UPI002FDC9BCB
MIRRPSTKAQQYAWHRAALSGSNPPQHDGLPECGWFRTRFVTGGPWVPVRIWCEQEIDPETGELLTDERLCCEADGMRRDPAKIWTYLEPISRADFEQLSDRREAIPAMAATMARLDLTERAMRP